MKFCSSGSSARGSDEGRLRQQLGLQGQQIAEDAGQRHDHVDARTAQLFERNQDSAGQTPVVIEARTGTDEGQRLPDRSAFRLEVVGTPEYQGDGLRESVAFRDVPLDQTRGLLGAVLDRKGARQPEGIEAVQIAPRRQNRRGAQQVSARCRTE